MVKILASLQTAAEAWALHAYLRSCALKLEGQYGTVEDALLMCMLHIWLIEELEG